MEIKISGRALKSFTEWFFKDNDEISNTDWPQVIDSLMDADDVIATAYVCEWFDSVGIYVLTHPLMHCKQNVATSHVCNWSVEIKDHIGYSDVINPAENRVEALKKGIEKANEIFNTRFDG